MAAPTIENVLPPVGALIEANASVSFDVVDADDDLFDVVIFAIFAGTGDWEVIWDGDRFAPRYAQSSSRVHIPLGFRYTLKRTGNWPEPPRLRVRAFDAALNALG